MCWGTPAFPLNSHLASSYFGVQAAEDPTLAEYESSTSAGLDGTSSLSESFSSIEPDLLPAGHKKIKKTESMTLSLVPSHPPSFPGSRANERPDARAVSNLTPEQLERKRRNDRRAQKAIRERTKQRIEEYQDVLAQKDEVIGALSRRVRVLEGELARQKGLPHGVLANGK